MMKLAMDADCLIKLTKAGLKETICTAWRVCIPPTVRRETVLAAPGRPDAVRIRANIAAGHVRVLAKGLAARRGEDAVLALFQSGGFDAIATDDRRFIRQLRGLGIPYMVPAVIVVRMRLDGIVSAQAAADALNALRPHIAADEYAVALLMLSTGETP